MRKLCAVLILVFCSGCAYLNIEKTYEDGRTVKVKAITGPGTTERISNLNIVRDKDKEQISLGEGTHDSKDTLAFLMAAVQAYLASQSIPKTAAPQNLPPAERMPSPTP